MASVLVLFHSQEHGNTAAMAAAVAEGIRQAGADAKLVNTNETRLAMDEYAAADAVGFGSPDYYSYIAGGMKMFLDDWFIAKKTKAPGLTGKPYALFYSHGGGGAVVGPMEKLFAKVGKKVAETVASKGRPDEKTLLACRELGRQLAQAAAK